VVGPLTPPSISSWTNRQRGLGMPRWGKKGVRDGWGLPIPGAVLLHVARCVTEMD